MSVLLFPPPNLRRPAILTALAAVSVCQTVLEFTDLHATIKWPNDVLIADKKVCGILIEQRTTGHAESPVVTAIGIGLNVAQSAAMLDDAGLPLATSMASVSQKNLSWEDAAKDLIARLDQHYRYLLEKDAKRLEALWNERLGLVGRNVVVERIAGTLRGKLVEMSFARLGVETSPGHVVPLLPESVRHIQPAD